MDIIQKKKAIYLQIIPLFVKYVDTISKTYNHIYDLVANIRIYLDNIATNLELIPTTKPGNSQQIFETIQCMNNIDSYLYYIYNALHFNIKDMPSEMSNTFLLELENEFKHIGVKYTFLVNDNNINSAKLIHIFMEEIKYEPIKTINDIFVKYKNTINLYTHYIQYKLDNIDPTSKEYVLALDSLESAKIIIINNTNIMGKKITNMDTKMQRYGLVPVWQHMDEQQVLKQALNIINIKDEISRNPGRMYGGYTPDKLSDMASLFMEKKMGLYVMVLISSNQIEFDYSTLVHKKTVDALPIPDNSGLNDNVIKKYDNIKNITGEFKDPVYKNIRLGKTDSDTWLVIRTLNGTHYDIMGFDTQNIFVNKVFVDKLDRGPSLLIDTYQRICSYKFVSHLKPPSVIVMDTATTPLQTISNTVIRQISLYVDEKLKNIPSNLNELFELVTGTDIEDITSRIIIESYDDIAGANTSELSSTFLYNADYIIKGFVKSVNERFAKSGLNEFMFKEKTKNALVVYIRTILLDIIKISAEKIFDPRKDIYEKIIIKKSLLNIEL
jgi:hypothetical protein